VEKVIHTKLHTLPTCDGAMDKIPDYETHGWAAHSASPVHWPVSTVRHLNRSGLTSFLVQPFLHSPYDPDHGAFYCWISVEFLRASNPRKESGSTTITTL